MEVSVEKRGVGLNKEKNIMKRKRLDARAFRDYHCSLARKSKTSICSGASSQTPDRILQPSSDNIEANSLKKQQQLVSTIRKSNCKEQRMILEVKPERDNEVAKQKDVVSVQSCEHASSSTNADLPEKSLCKMIEGGAADNKVNASDGTNKDEMQGESNCSLPRSDELFDLKPSSTMFSEYWVPAGFSQLQLEQYCRILVQNSLYLCSSKKGNGDTLHDILNSIKKCCDHPYIADQSLVRFVNEGRSPVDILNTGVEVSGKLVLLDKFLQEAKQKEARVLIVFQSNHKHSLQHILDDFLCRRFGEESYVHVYREYDSLKKQAVLDHFNNDKKGKRFVVLIEKSSCHPSIKLSTVDFVILFNSDSTPANDMKSIQKMSIQPRHDHVKVLRLYLAHSVEEKLLSLAKKGDVLETRSYNFSHTLLLWGTPYLFSKLDDFHRHSSLDNSNNLVEEKLLPDVLHEMTGLLSCQNTDKGGISLISKFSEGCSDARDISLYGEKDASPRDDDLPHFALWVYLLEGRNPVWKLLPENSEKIKRRVECVAKDNMTMINKVLGCELRGGSLSVKPRLRKPRSSIRRSKRRKLVVHSTSESDGGKSDCSNSVEKACNIRMKKLLSNQKDEIREFHRTKMEKRAALEDERQLVVNVTCQKYGETTEKQEELKKLDNLYREKVKELDHQMDRKIKALGIAQRASRIKEKQLKDRLLPTSKKKNIAGPIASPVSAPLLDWKPEKQSSNGSEHNRVDESFRSDHGVVSNPLLVETEVLSGDGSTNMELSGDHFPGVRVQVNNPLGVSLSPSFESHGENDMTVPYEKTPDASGLNNTKTLSNLPEKELSDGETKNRDAGFYTACQQTRTQDRTTSEQPDDFESRQCPLSAQNCSEPLSSFSNRKVQCLENEMDSEREGRVAVRNELLSSRQSAPNCVLTQPQTCIITGNGSPLEQPMTCTTQESNHTDSSCDWQTILRSIESSRSHFLRVAQPVAIPTTTSITHDVTPNIPTTTSITHDVTPNSSVTATSFVPPVVNDSLTGLSSSTLNIFPPPTSDPLANELLRMKIEETAVINLHKEQVELLQSARKKEMDEINAKFNLLEQEVENALVKKKEDMNSYYQKVCANKILAETMAVFACTNKTVNFEMPLDGTHLHPTLGSGIQPRAEHTAPPVQVVHQSSGLPPLDLLQTVRYPLTGYQARDPAPLLSSYQPISSMPVTQTPFHGVPIHIQQNLVGPQTPQLTSYQPISSTPISHNSSPFHAVPTHIQQNLVGLQNSFLSSCTVDRLSGLTVQHDGSQVNPIFL